jgi:hypothetical protein
MNIHTFKTDNMKVQIDLFSEQYIENLYISYSKDWRTGIFKWQGRLQFHNNSLTGEKYFERVSTLEELLGNINQFIKSLKEPK